MNEKSKKSLVWAARAGSEKETWMKKNGNTDPVFMERPIFVSKNIHLIRLEIEKMWEKKKPISCAVAVWWPDGFSSLLALRHTHAVEKCTCSHRVCTISRVDGSQRHSHSHQSKYLFVYKIKHARHTDSKPTHSHSHTIRLRSRTIPSHTWRNNNNKIVITLREHMHLFSNSLHSSKIFSSFGVLGSLRI